MSDDEIIILTIPEYSKLFGIPEPTIRSRMRMGKIQTIQTDRDGKTMHGIRVPKTELPADDGHIITDNEPSSNPSSINNQSSLFNYSEMVTDYQKMISDRDETIKDLMERLKFAEIRCAALEGELKKVPELGRTIEALHKTIAAQEEAIDAHKSATEAMKNERTTMTYALQKYRDKEEDQPRESPRKKSWWLWG